MSDSNRSAHDQIGSFLQGKMGASDGTFEGNLGFDSSQTNKSHTKHFPNKNLKSKASAQPALSLNPALTKTAVTHSGGKTSTTSSSNNDWEGLAGFLQAIFEGSDWLFEPIEDFVPNEILKIVLKTLSIAGFFLGGFAVTEDIFNIISAFIGAISFYFAPIAAYICLRLLVGLVTILLIITFYLAMCLTGLAALFYILAIFVN